MNIEKYMEYTNAFLQTVRVFEVDRRLASILDNATHTPRTF